MTHYPQCFHHYIITAELCKACISCLCVFLTGARIWLCKMMKMITLRMKIILLNWLVCSYLLLLSISSSLLLTEHHPYQKNQVR